MCYGPMFKGCSMLSIWCPFVVACFTMFSCVLCFCYWPVLELVSVLIFAILFSHTMLRNAYFLAQQVFDYMLHDLGSIPMFWSTIFYHMLPCSCLIPSCDVYLFPIPYDYRFSLLSFLVHWRDLCLVFSLHNSRFS